MAITWATPAIAPAMQVQGPVLLYYGTYAASGADASGTVSYAGILSAKDGAEWTVKQTYNRTEIQQSTYPLNSFLTKSEASWKVTVSHADPALMNVLLGYQSGSYTAGSMSADQNKQTFIDPFNAESESAVPSMRPTYRQILLRFPSPGFDGTTSPIGAWSYFQIWRGYFTPAGNPKVGRDNLMEFPITINADLDPSVSVPSIGQWVTVKP